MLRRKRTLGILAVVILVPVIGIAWWLLAPLFTSTTVEEEFPFAAKAIVPADMDQAQVEQVMSGLANVGESSNEDMPLPVDPRSELTKTLSARKADATDAVVKSLANAAVKSMPGTMTAPAKDEMTQKIAEAMKDALPEVIAKAEAQSASEPVRLKLGQFRDQDRFHRGTGTATIYSLADGTQLLRLTDLQVTNGPDLRVILTRSQNPEEAGQGTDPGHLELAKLKGNMGNHNYPISNDADVSTFNSVVVFCKPFRVIFSVASLKSAG